MLTLVAGFFAEGPTDYRFLCPVLERVLEEMAYECQGQIDIIMVEVKVEVKVEKTGKGFQEQVVVAFRKSMEMGASMLMLHADADDRETKRTYETRINPAIEAIRNISDGSFRFAVAPVVPIQAMEAWMLADKALLKEEIGTTLSDVELGIDRNPEDIADPKEVLKKAITMTMADQPKRRRQGFGIGELYGPMGNKIRLEALQELSAFRDMKHHIKQVFISLNLMEA